MEKGTAATTMEERQASKVHYTGRDRVFLLWEKGHVKRDCRVKLEVAKCSMVATTAPPKWTKTVQINGKEMEALVDTGCNKTLVHLRWVGEDDYLGWNISYYTASGQKTYFPAASV